MPHTSFIPCFQLFYHKMNIWVSPDVLRELLKSILALLKVICSCKSILKVCCHLVGRDIITETLRDGERERELGRGNEIL